MRSMNRRPLKATVFRVLSFLQSLAQQPSIFLKQHANRPRLSFLGDVKDVNTKNSAGFHDGFTNLFL